METGAKDVVERQPLNYIVDPPSIKVGTVSVNKLINEIRLSVILLDVERLDLLVICETWLTSEVPSSFVDISVYNFFCKDVAGTTTKHGVGLYIRKNNSACND